MFSSINWFEVIVVGIALDILKKYLYPKTEALATRFSEARRLKKEEQEKKVQEEVKRLLLSPHEELIFRSTYKNVLSFHRSFSNFGLSLNVAALIMASIGDNGIFLAILAMLGSFVTSFFLERRTKDLPLLQKVRKQLDKEKGRPDYETW